MELKGRVDFVVCSVAEGKNAQAAGEVSVRGGTLEPSHFVELKHQHADDDQATGTLDDARCIALSCHACAFAAAHRSFQYLILSGISICPGNRRLVAEDRPAQTSIPSAAAATPPGDRGHRSCTHGGLEH